MKKTRRSKTKRNALIMLTITIALTIIVASAIKNQNNSQRNEKPLASKYFKVDPLTSIGNFSSDNKTVFLTVLALNITAIGGDAHGVTINTDGMMMDPDSDKYPYIDYLARGQSREVIINLNTAPREWDDRAGGYSVEIMISCQEVVPDTITVYLKPEQIK
jgi:hypothetical protein